MTDATRTLHRTTVTIWTDYDPSRQELTSLAREADSGDGFATGMSTEEVPVSALIGDPNIGDDLLEFFSVSVPPLCQNGVCADGEQQAGIAVALMFDNAFQKWVLTCASHADGWFDDDVPDEQRIRFDLHRFPCEGDVDERLAHLTTGQLAEIGRRVYNVLEYGGEGKRGREWEPDDFQGIARVFDAHGVRFTSPDDADDDGQGVPAFPDEGESVRGCPCGMADYGAPGHEGHTDTNREGYVLTVGADVDGQRVPVAEVGPFREYLDAYKLGLGLLDRPAGAVLGLPAWAELEGGKRAEQAGATIAGFDVDVYVDGETLYTLSTNLRRKAAPARAVQIRAPQPFDAFSAAHTMTPIAAYNPDSPWNQKYGPDYFLSEQGLARYLRGAGSATVVFDLDRTTGQWAARKTPIPAAKPSRSGGQGHGDWKLTSRVPDEIAAEQGWTDETLGTLARRFLAGADPETQRGFNAFLVDVQADENA